MTPVTFHVSHRKGIYRVTRDGVFHGDYIKELWAHESAEDAARTLRKQGRRVDIVKDKEQPPRT
jgi:hypothetical protein